MSMEPPFDRSRGLTRFGPMDRYVHISREDRMARLASLALFSVVVGCHRNTGAGGQNGPSWDDSGYPSDDSGWPDTGDDTGGTIVGEDADADIDTDTDTD